MTKILTRIVQGRILFVLLQNQKIGYPGQTLSYVSDVARSEFMHFHDVVSSVGRYEHARFKDFHLERFGFWKKHEEEKY